MLEECGWCIYETTKKLYYQAKNEPRFKSIFVAQTDKTRPAPEEEMVHVAEAETLKPGNPIAQRFSHPVLGSGQCTLSAIGDADNTWAVILVCVKDFTGSVRGFFEDIAADILTVATLDQAGLLREITDRSYSKKGRYTVAVKVIDIFGNDTMMLVPVSVG